MQEEGWATCLPLLQKALDNWPSASHGEQIQICILHVAHQQASMQQEADVRLCHSVAGAPTASTPDPAHQVPNLMRLLIKYVRVIQQFDAELPHNGTLHSLTLSRHELAEQPCPRQA